MSEVTYTAEDYHKALIMACTDIIKEELSKDGYSSRIAEIVQHYMAEVCG